MTSKLEFHVADDRAVQADFMHLVTELAQKILFKTGEGSRRVVFYFFNRTKSSRRLLSSRGRRVVPRLRVRGRRVVFCGFDH